MALNMFGLGFLFTAKDQASQVMRGVETNLASVDRAAKKSATNTQKATAGAAVGLGAMAAGAGVVSTAMKAAFAAGTFEQGVARVGNISQASAEQLGMLSQRAIQAGLDTQFSPAEAIGGLAELAVRGLTAEESMTALSGALNLAAGGQISIAQASSTTASALKVFGLSADQAAATSDKLLKISTLTAIQANELELALGNVGRGASIAQQSLEEMLPAIGLVRNTGVDISVASSSVSSALLAMSKNADKFKKLGVSLTDSQGNFRPLMSIILDTHQALSGFTKQTTKTAKATDLFGRFGLTAFSAIGTQLKNGIVTATGDIVKNAQAMDFLRKATKDAAGTGDAFTKALLDTLPGQLKLLEGSLQTFAVVAGKPLKEIFTPFVTGVKDAVNVLIAGFSAIPEPIQKVITGAIVLTGALVGVGGAALTLFSILKFTPLISGFTAAFSAFSAAAAPLLPIIGALVAAGAALRFAWVRDLGGIATFFEKTSDKIGMIVEGVQQHFEKGFIIGDLTKKENEGLSKFTSSLITTLTRAQRFFTGFIDGVEQGFNRLEPIFVIISASFGLVMKAVKSLTGFVSGKTIGALDDFTSAGRLFGETIFFIAGGLALWTVRTVAVTAAQFAFNTVLIVAKGVMLAFRLRTLAVIAAQYAFTGALIITKGVMLAFQGVVLLVQGAMYLLSLATKIGTAFTWANVTATLASSGALATAATSAAGFATATLAVKAATVGLIAGVAYLGWEVGKLIDKYTGASDALANFLGELTGQNEEMERLNKLNGGLAAGRSTPAFLGSTLPVSTPVTPMSPAPPMKHANQTTGAAEAEAESARGSMAAITKPLQDLVGLLTGSQQAAAAGNINVNVSLDGEALGNAQTKIQKAASALAFGSDIFSED